jgi:hypothetical protein
MELINIWEQEPPRNTKILFMLGDESIHEGIILSDDNLPKCDFYSYIDHKFYECDSSVPLKSRVTHWGPINEESDKEENELD